MIGAPEDPVPGNATGTPAIRVEVQGARGIGRFALVIECALGVLLAVLILRSTPLVEPPGAVAPAAGEEALTALAEVRDLLVESWDYRIESNGATLRMQGEKGSATLGLDAPRDALTVAREGVPSVYRLEGVLRSLTFRELQRGVVVIEITLRSPVGSSLESIPVPYTEVVRIPAIASMHLEPPYSPLPVRRRFLSDADGQ